MIYRSIMQIIPILQILTSHHTHTTYNSPFTSYITPLIPIVINITPIILLYFVQLTINHTMHLSIQFIYSNRSIGKIVRFIQTQIVNQTITQKQKF